MLVDVHLQVDIAPEIWQREHRSDPDPVEDQVRRYVLSLARLSVMSLERDSIRSVEFAA